ncbi:LON peptidase substrate-binding domain-containing protein [Polluticoccus soli]|uniref:LON peptidase substrate-binding domain-containing protein n=1 Tax=Polluticoccus soli TaxID=3034150 RepID=UPI0023E2BF68|nr:LON peptidase substrate-binding domain-containing protein [Flavipsychrobacter sp. JY13-12]
MNFIPIFPLDVVVYPGEPLNLHIFEPRYKQLINECMRERKAFGIPVVLDKDQGVREYGTSIEILELVKEYENGEMDVRTRGLNVFRILEVVKEIPDKLFSGAIVSYPQNFMASGDSNLANHVFSEVKRLYALLSLSEKFPEQKKPMVSYEIAHQVGLTKEQEYELLSIFTEIQRLEYLRRHLDNMTKVVQELEKVKERIQLNGHFKNLSLGDIDL